MKIELIRHGEPVGPKQTLELIRFELVWFELIRCFLNKKTARFWQGHGKHLNLSSHWTYPTWTIRLGLYWRKQNTKRRRGRRRSRRGGKAETSWIANATDFHKPLLESHWGTARLQHSAETWERPSSRSSGQSHLRESTLDLGDLVLSPWTPPAPLGARQGCLSWTLSGETALHYRYS